MTQEDAAIFYGLMTLGGFFLIIILAAYFGTKWYNKFLKKQQLIFEQWAQSKGLNISPSARVASISLSSFNEGEVIKAVSGVVENANNRFDIYWQSESRGSGKNRRVYNRTILAIVIPDTQLQMIINSKINNDSNSGGNLNVFNKQQRFSLEGDFGTFFDIYMPQTTQSETLSMLTPDSMLYIMSEFADYDIEINGPLLYIYSYRNMHTSQIDILLPKLDKLLTEMRLRTSDTRQEKVTNALVARTATDSATHRKSLKKDVRYVGILFVVLYAASYIDHPIVSYVIVVVFLFFVIKLLYDSAKQASLKRKYNKVISQYK